MVNIHFLEEQGDIWRMMRAEGPVPAQPSRTVGGSHDYVIPFRQLEFKNAFIEWVVCDNIKHRKAAS